MDKKESEVRLHVYKLAISMVAVDRRALGLVTPINSGIRSFMCDILEEEEQIGRIGLVNIRLRL
jgi:hypothetical protein